MTVAEALQTALRNVSCAQVHHPILHIQERVLCYELYHQLRLLEECRAWEIRPARVQAELDKEAQHIFRKDFGEREPVPDILVHEPGTPDHNLAVVEVKRINSSRGEIEHDLRKLAYFGQGRLRYRELILVLFCTDDWQQPALPHPLCVAGAPTDIAVKLLLYHPYRRTVGVTEVRSTGTVG